MTRTSNTLVNVFAFSIGMIAQGNVEDQAPNYQHPGLCKSIGGANDI